jgi:hypothetical protein
MKINEAEILRRAKALCEQDGALWHPDDLEAQPERRDGSMKGTWLINGEERRMYLTRAREELLKEHE